MLTSALCATLLVVVILPADSYVYNSNNEYNQLESYIDENLPKIIPYLTDKEYIRQSMINAYRRDKMGGRLVIETNALINTKYKAWKRNADLINSLLALPKGLNEAGR